MSRSKNRFVEDMINAEIEKIQDKSHFASLGNQCYINETTGQVFDYPTCTIYESQPGIGKTYSFNVPREKCDTILKHFQSKCTNVGRVGNMSNLCCKLEYCKH